MDRSLFRLRLTVGLGLLGGALLGGCSSGGGGSESGTQVGIPGSEVAKPGLSTTFFVDPNRGGDASRLLLEEMFWGRLVDVHDVDANGVTSVRPVFTNFVINESIRTDVTNYVLETNPITQRVRLIIQRTKGEPDAGFGTFDDLLLQAESSMPPILPYGDRDRLITNPNIDPDLIARNACLVLRFNDALDDGLEAQGLLTETVRVTTEYPPDRPFAPRLLFDENHGALIGGVFHSTRVLVDMTVSEEEAASSNTTAPINNLGLPASLSGNGNPNVAVRIPTRAAQGMGQFSVLRNLSGASVSAIAANAPLDELSPTEDLVRGMRSGRSDDANNGFLTDLNPPEILGGWAFEVTFAAEDPAGVPGFDFVLAGAFTSPCRSSMQPGDILALDEQFLEIVEPTGDPNNLGEIPSVRVRLLGEAPIVNINQLLGTSLFRSTYDPTVTVSSACWVTFTPNPRTLPSTDVSPISVVQVSFTEPMDPNSVQPFSTMQLVRGSVDVDPSASNSVVGEVVSSPDLRRFTLDPRLDLAHTQASEQYHLRLEGPRDLAGNGLPNQLPFVLFTVDPDEPAVTNDGIVLRFESTDETGTPGANDLTGQFFYDFDTGVIRPRPVQFASDSVDRSNPITSAHVPITTGIQTPLVPLGSKLHFVWRYCDFGFQVLDATKFNLDVTGVSWTPVGGQVLADFFEEFEMRLSHSSRLPDEESNQFALPIYVNSGLSGSNGLYESNILGGEEGQVITHDRNRGYRVDPGQLSQNGNGTFLIPYPMNVGVDNADIVTYTWRDTADLSLAGGQGTGIPMGIEVQRELEENRGEVAAPGSVPTIGLPLLVEIRAFASTEAVGLNGLDISIANNNSVLPIFRNFSSGGFDTMGNAVTRDPDNLPRPRGGFNPTSTPPGGTTRGDDPVIYVGAIDHVTRISRVFTIWLDTGVSEPDFQAPVFEPLAASRPVGTDVVIDYRGATGFDLLAGSRPFDAQQLTSYGDPTFDGQQGSTLVDFITGENVWFDEIDSIDGARYLQMRISFTSNVATGLRPELSAIGIAYDIED